MDIQKFLEMTDRAASNSDAVIAELRDTMGNIYDAGDGAVEPVYTDDDQERRLDEFDDALEVAAAEAAPDRNKAEIDGFVSGLLVGLAVANQVGLHPVTEAHEAEVPDQAE